MGFRFSPNSAINAILVSGDDSVNCPNYYYLQIDGEEKSYEIRFEYFCSPFEYAIKIDDLLAIGYQENFYLFDTKKEQNILSLKLDGYFGNLYFDRNLLYVCDAIGIYCINKSGDIGWQNKNIAIDGVIITDFLEDRILVNAELDPPDGWQKYELDNLTGNKL